MESPRIELLGMASNSIVVQTTYRRFPGIVIQGDTLDSWLCILDECQRCIADTEIDEAGECIAELKSMINAQLIHYESVLSQFGIALPYATRNNVTD